MSARNSSAHTLVDMRLAVAAIGSNWAVSAVYISIARSIYLFAIAGKSAAKLQTNMACVQELANRIWAGRDVEMISTA